MPKFSIVTVVRNDLDGLRKTAESVCVQQLDDYEWIVIDGASSDGTIAYLNSLQLNSLKWISESDRGIYDAMNKGILLSRGEYLVFLNAGDTFPAANTLHLVNQSILSAANPGVLFGGTEYVFPDGKSLFRAPKIISKCIWHGLPANHQASYYSRGALNGFLYDLKYRICGDYYLAAQMYKKKCGVAYLDVPLVKFSVGGASYVNRIPLFLEPYAIQRDVLGQPLFWRLVSFVKRGISTMGMIALQNLHRVKRPVINPPLP